MVLASPRANTRAFRIVPPAFYGDINAAFDDEAQRRIVWQLVEWQRLSAEVINQLMDGKDNATGTVTLATSAATTTLQDARIGAQTKVVLIPLSAAALADVPWQTYPNTTEGQAVLNHASDPGTREFAYCLRG